MNHLEIADLALSGTPKWIRLISALIFLSVGLDALYVVRKHWGYVSQLPDSPGNRKTKRQQKILLVVGFLFLLGAVWKLSLFLASK